MVAEYPHKKIERSKLTALFLKCHNLTDYLTFKTDFLKLVEFSQWVRENYPDKVPKIRTMVLMFLAMSQKSVVRFGNSF